MLPLIFFLVRGPFNWLRGPFKSSRLRGFSHVEAGGRPARDPQNAARPAQLSGNIGPCSRLQSTNSCWIALRGQDPSLPPPVMPAMAK